MPSAAPRPCNHPGCRHYQAQKGYCSEHQKDRRGYDDRRGTASQRGYNVDWRRYREQFLREHPFCIECEKQGLLVAATVVDHKQPHKGDQDLFWRPSNHQSMCASCHSRKTATEDMGAWDDGHVRSTRREQGGV